GAAAVAAVVAGTAQEEHAPGGREPLAHDARDRAAGGFHERVDRHARRHRARVGLGHLPRGVEPPQATASAMRASTSSLSSTAAAAAFSSICSTRVAPVMTLVTPG